MANKIDEEVQVRITASQRVFYEQTVAMSRTQYEKMSKMPGRQLEDKDGPLTNHLDLRNVYSGDDFEDVYMAITGKA